MASFDSLYKTEKTNEDLSTSRLNSQPAPSTKKTGLLKTLLKASLCGGLLAGTYATYRIGSNLHEAHNRAVDACQINRHSVLAQCYMTSSYCWPSNQGIEPLIVEEHMQSFSSVYLKSKINLMQVQRNTEVKQGKNVSKLDNEIKELMYQHSTKVWSAKNSFRYQQSKAEDAAEHSFVPLPELRDILSKVKAMSCENYEKYLKYTQAAFPTSLLMQEFIFPPIPTIIHIGERPLKTDFELANDCDKNFKNICPEKSSSMLEWVWANIKN